MKRREFVEKIGGGTVAVATAGVLGSVIHDASASEAHHQAADDGNLDGPLAAATVSFGSWMLPLDRYPNNSPRTANHHKLLPYTVTIKAGGAVTFLISGTHQILIYAPGTALADVQRIIVDAVPPPGPPPPFPGFINDPNNRIYRGLDPRPLAADRQESVTLADKGTYLVVCGVVPHFDEGMHGWIKVV